MSETQGKKSTLRWQSIAGAGAAFFDEAARMRAGGNERDARPDGVRLKLATAAGRYVARFGLTPYVPPLRKLTSSGLTPA